MYIKDRLRRSMMFVPGNNPGMIRDAHDRDIYREYISFRCYQGKVIPSIERRRKEEFELFYIP